VGLIEDNTVPTCTVSEIKGGRNGRDSPLDLVHDRILLHQRSLLHESLVLSTEARLHDSIYKTVSDGIGIRNEGRTAGEDDIVLLQILDIVDPVRSMEDEDLSSRVSHLVIL
jgi:hypothetical protein